VGVEEDPQLGTRRRYVFLEDDTRLYLDDESFAKAAVMVANANADRKVDEAREDREITGLKRLLRAVLRKLPTNKKGSVISEMSYWSRRDFLGDQLDARVKKALRS
jgi:hypothetical protein